MQNQEPNAGEQHSCLRLTFSSIQFNFHLSLKFSETKCEDLLNMSRHANSVKTIQATEMEHFIQLKKIRKLEL